MATNDKNKTRQVKLYGKMFPIPKNSWFCKEREVPWLNVSGVWLEQAGFSIGDRVNIKVGRKRLIITRQDEKD